MTEADADLMQGVYGESVRTHELAWFSREVNAVAALIVDNRYLLSGVQF